MADSFIRTLVDGSTSIRTGIRDISRARQIGTILMKHGFSEALEKTGIRKTDDETLTGLPKRLSALLEDLGPTFVKFGQILSTRNDVLPKEFVEAFVRLQDHVEPMSFDVVKEIIEGEIEQTLDEVFDEVDEAPLASASIAQVHCARLNGERVVIKVQRPGLRTQIVSDLSLLRFLIQRILHIYPELHVLDLKGTLDTYSSSLLGELDFKREAESIEQFADNFEDIAHVKIPKVYTSHSTGMMIVMEEIDGGKLTELKNPGDIEKAAKNYLDVAFKMFFEHGLFHGDLHPGNVFWLEDGKLGLIDFGTVGHVSKSLRASMGDVVLAILREDLPAVARTWLRIGQASRPIDYNQYEQDVVSILEQHVVGKPLKSVQFGLFLNDMSQGAIRHGIRVPSHLTVLFKAMITTEGLARQLLPDVDVVSAARPYIEASLKEKYSPDAIKQELVRQALQWSEASQNLPWRLEQILGRLESGDFQMQVETSGMEKLSDSMGKGLNRLALAIVAVGFGIGGVFVRNASGEQYAGFPMESIVAWGVMAGALFLLFSRMRSDK